MLGIVGESGCGKSVTMLSLAAAAAGDRSGHRARPLQTASDLLQATPARLRDIRGKEISFVFQEPMTSLNPAFTVGKQIGEVLRLHLGLSQGAGEAAHDRAARPRAHPCGRRAA